ncbi:MAG: hypothetical protein AB7Y46_17620 [Armatimonadota bacterium]
MGVSLLQFLAPVLCLLIILYAFALILGLHKEAGHAASAATAGTVRLTCWLIRVLVLFVVNTTMLLFRLVSHISRPEFMSDDLARWVERMADAVVGR